VLDVLTAGRLVGKATPRTAKNGSAYVTCTLHLTAANGETLFASVLSFAESVMRALQALEDGDSVALVAELTPKVWMDQDGTARIALDLRAHAVLSAYNVLRKRQVMKANNGTPVLEPEAQAEVFDGSF
jgi:single-stranded DNA-binding protein